MPCYKPLNAAVLKSDNGTKAKVKILKRSLPMADVAKYGTPTPLPCGSCIGCRLERSRQWAIRLMKELKLHDRASFLTLTYDNKNLPCLPDGRSTLKLEDPQKFLKRLREHFSPHRLRFFLCGEYGENGGRAHYHMILFGEDFIKDRVSIEDSPSGFPQWMSPLLTEKWGLGRAVIGEVSFESAAYVARYCLKKYSGSGKIFHYRGQKPEFVTMSRNPGIASAYFDEFKNDMYPSDEIIPSIGRPASLPPKYFDRLLERVDPALYEAVKKNRTADLDFYSDPNSTDSRLAERLRVKQNIIKNTLKRT